MGYGWLGMGPWAAVGAAETEAEGGAEDAAAADDDVELVVEADADVGCGGMAARSRGTVRRSRCGGRWRGCAMRHTCSTAGGSRAVRQA